MDNNAYLLRCTDTGAQLLIDAANEAPRLLELVGDAGLATVVTTHQHMDHWVALEEVVAKTGARPLVHVDDAAGLPIEAEPLADGDTVTVGERALEVIHLRGHTPGSIALLYRDPAGTPHLFTGDSLFPGGVGNTDRDPQRFGQLIDDVEHGCSTGCPTRRGSTRATAGTARSARSARRCRSGGRAAGEPAPGRAAGPLTRRTTRRPPPRGGRADRPRAAAPGQRGRSTSTWRIGVSTAGSVVGTR